MCGIAGVFDPRRRLGAWHLREVAEAMAAQLVHRGPDDRGTWVSEDGLCALAHRRLTIIDPSTAGRQPMQSRSGECIISLNGEVYNFRELRRELEAGGLRFSTQTDTEVLLEAFGVFGEDVYERVEGMYAFGLFDSRHRCLTLARDPFGEKPLYYTTQGGAIAFASELNAFLAVPWFDPEIRVEAVAEYLALRYVQSPATIYRETFKIDPGAWIRIEEDGRLKYGRHFYFDPDGANADRSANPEERLDAIEDAVVGAVRRCMVSDFPLGAFLSSGVDSSLVVAIAQKIAGEPLRTFSIGFAGACESEHLGAGETAEFLGCRHSMRLLSSGALESVPAIAQAMDEPNGDRSCLPTYLLSALAREDVKVALSGDGGDELFGGYETYIQLLGSREGKAKAPSRPTSPGDAYLKMMMTFSREEVALLIGELPRETADLLSSLASTVNREDRPLISGLRSADSRSFLPGSVLSKVDRMSMRHSLEVRCPLLNRKIASIAARLRPEECLARGQGKVLLRRLASRYLPKEWMERPKRGFGFPEGWPKPEAIRAMAREHLVGGESRIREWIGSQNLRRFLARQESDLTFNAAQTWSLLILELWLQSHARARVPLAVTSSSRSLDLSILTHGENEKVLSLDSLSPRGTVSGVGFNVQDNGFAAISLTCSNAGPWSSILFDGQELKTAFASASELTALVPPDLYVRPGAHPVCLVDGARRSDSLDFEVAERPGSATSLVLKSLQPSRAVAGGGFNRQPDGQSAIAVEAENAGPDTVILFDSLVLPTEFGSPSHLSALVPPGPAGSVGRHGVCLRDGDRLSKVLDFEVVAPSIDTEALVSIVIPCFNQARFLAESIESALGQTHGRIEVIVVDDGSTDETPQVVSRFPSVRYIRQKNGGLPGARNRGLEEARGEFILFLDADDRLLPRAVEMGLRAIGADPACAFAFGHYRSITENGLPFIEAPPVESGEDFYAALLGGNIVGTTATALFRRSLLRSIGGFDCLPEFRGCEDYALYLRLAREFRVERYAEVVAEYRLHLSSMTYDAARRMTSVVSILRAERSALKADPERRNQWRQGLRGWREHYVRSILADVVARRRSLGLMSVLRRLVQTFRFAPVELVRIGSGVRCSPPTTFVIGNLPTEEQPPTTRRRYRTLRLHPSSTAPGQNFNVQPSGLSAIAVECKGASGDSVVVFGETPLWTTYGGPNLLTAMVPPELYERRGQAPVYVIRVPERRDPTLAHLEDIRRFELKIVLGLMPHRGRMLEIGAGTGWQARTLHDEGFDVSAIDIASSLYRDHRVWPVTEYDGKRIPFEDDSFDVVFSSNVLEHVGRTSEFQEESRRVVKPGGYAIHVVPSSSWRFWTSLMHWLRNWTLPTVHGELAENAFSEMFTFSRYWWRRVFRRAGWQVLACRRNELFYTGAAVMDHHLGIEARHLLSGILGSACHIFVLRKPARASTRSLTD